jgi:hypothetical protein
VAVATAVAGLGILLGTAPAEAVDPAGAVVGAAPDATTATVTAGDRTLRVAVSPQSGLAPSGAELTVSGSGFDTSHDLWIAVCEDDGAAPAALLHCVGGAIPDENSTTGWGVVTSDKHPPYAGPVTTSWAKKGSFSLTLRLPSAMSEDADCISASCSVYTRSADDSDRSQDVRVPVSFASPPAESSTGPGGASSDVPPTTSSEPSTSLEPTTATIGVIATTVTPEIMLQTSAAPGTEQTVLFAGFIPGEKVDVTLYSDPVKLPAATADPTGNVRISFTVPKDLPPGEHLVQAIGRKSGRVGIAQFTVGTAPTTTASASASVSASASASASASMTASAAESGAVGSAVSEPVSSAAASSAVTSPSTSAVATSSSTVAAVAGGTGNRLLWLWIVLAVLVVVGGAAGVIVMVRSRRDRDDDLPRATENVPPAPGWSAGGAAVPATGTVTGAPTSEIDPGGFGLLSGRDHPDGPVLYSGGQWPGQPTSVIGAGPGDSGPGGAGGPSTEQWTPEFTAPTASSPASPTPSPAPDSPTQVSPPSRPNTGAGGDGGPSTQQWRPDFTAPTPADGPAAAGDQPAAAPDQPPAGPDRPAVPPVQPPVDGSTGEGDGRPGGRHRND